MRIRYDRTKYKEGFKFLTRGSKVRTSTPGTRYPTARTEAKNVQRACTFPVHTMVEVKRTEFFSLAFLNVLSVRSKLWLVRTTTYRIRFEFNQVG